MRTFLDIANIALGRLGEIQLTTSQFNTGTTVEASLPRSVLLTAYRELAFSGHSDFRETFTFPTVISQNEYDLSFPFSDIDRDSLRLIKATNADVWLRYASEQEILAIYPDVSDMNTGEPFKWWIKTTGSESVKKLAFDVIPDAIYTIVGIKKIDPNSIASIVATDTTVCNAKGDRALEDWLYWEKRYVDGQIDLEIKDKKQLQVKASYIASKSNQELSSYIETPRQERGRNRMHQTLSGRVWFD